MQTRGPFRLGDGAVAGRQIDSTEEVESMRTVAQEPVMVPVAELKAYDTNAKKHTRKQIDAVKASIEQFGFRGFVIAWHDEAGEPEIVAGHARCRAAQELGMQEVPVVFCDDLTDAQRRALTLADNQTTMMTGWDEDLLAYELDTLAGEFDMADFGFDTEPGGDGAAGEAYAMADVEALDIRRDYIVLTFEDDNDFLQACQLLGVEEGQVPRTRNVSGIGLGRVVDGVRALEAARS